MRPRSVHVERIVIAGPAALRPQLLARLAQDALAGGAPAGNAAEARVARAVAQAVRRAIDTTGGGR